MMDRSADPEQDGRTPVRVAFVIPTIENGGAEQQLLALAGSLDRSQWSPRVFCTHALGNLEARFAEAGVAVELIGKRGAFDVTVVWRLARALKRYDPAVVHTWLFQADTWGRLAARLLRPASVVISSQRTMESHWPRRYHLIDRLLSRWTDAVVANSNAVARFAVDVKGISAAKLVTIQNGTDMSRAQACLGWTRDQRLDLRRELGISDETFVVGHIAQPAVEKRFDVLVDVLAKLVEQSVPVRILQLGRNPQSREEERYFASYRSWLDERGVADRVQRLGFVVDVSRYLAGMDAVVQTSGIEGFPNAIIEALAMERPVVATNAGGTGDMIRHGETGWLVEPGDADGLVEGLLNAYRDSEQAQAWARVGRELVEREFSVDALVGNTTNLYHELLKWRGPSA